MWQAIVNFLPNWRIGIQAMLTLVIPVLIYRLYKLIYSWGITPKQHSSDSEVNEDHQLTGNFDDDIVELKDRIGMNDDVHFREFRMNYRGKRAMLIFVDGMQNEAMINRQVMEQLMEASVPYVQGNINQSNNEQLMRYLQERLLPVSKLNTENMMKKVELAILTGVSVLLIEGLPEAFLVGEPTPKVRAINEPVSEAMLRGPRVGFTEVLSENTAMLRQQGSTSDLEMIMTEVGSRVKRNLVVAYMKEIVNQDLLQEVKDRLSNINHDFIAESGYVEQFIEDNWLSPFQQVQSTERPDRVINGMLEGRVAILLDGTPFALIVPVTFSMLLQSPEDYYERWIPSSLLRALRFFAAFLALMTPALYISFISFHPGLIPTELAITIIKTRQGVPFPSLIEVLILEISIEILREAGIRLPKPIGPAMGIVGGLIIGDAAVQAGIVSPILVIAVAVTAISSFSIPVYSAGITLRMLRFAGMLFAAVLGMYGTILFFILLCSHMTKLKSFGVPYVTPISPYRLSDWKDLFVRVPVTLMRSRPNMMKTRDKQRKS